MDIRTLTDIYEVTCGIDRHAAMKYKKGGKWHDISVAQFRDTVRHFSTGLRTLGVRPGDRVAILSENRPEWTLADMAILCAGAVTVPVYPTLLGWQIEYILNDSGCTVIICSDPTQLDKVLEIRSHCPSMQHVIVCDPPSQSLPDRVMSFGQVTEAGKAEEEKHGRARFDELRAAAKADDLATIVYTSGTTGNPKGAMLTHGNIASNVQTTSRLLPLQPGWTALSILPLSHIFERMIDFVYLYNGVCIAYAEDVTKVADNLQEIRPQVF
ncbi:MAG TPA: AMP-binding protein, partial [Thermoanaerobaculia bacterium]|nr:AMP-binding protein [Thermoanaerobaculia bacterium]